MFEILNLIKWWDFFSLSLILLVGLPHGALDAAVGFSIGLFNNLKLKFFFVLSYLSLAILVVIMWYQFSEYLLVLFLYVSIFHFGLGDQNWKNSVIFYINAYFYGGTIIFGISFINYDQVGYIYSILASGETHLVWKALHLGAYIWIFITPVFIYLNYRNFCIRSISKYCLLVLIIIFLPPLVAFAYYFCFVHSINHFRRIIPEIYKYQSKRNILKYFIIFTVLSWCIGLIVFFILSIHLTYTDSLFFVTFVGLASLTFPHMFLVDYLFRPKLKV